MRIDRLDPTQTEAALTGLAEILVDCVAGGASVGFLSSLTVEEARDWWREALGPAVTITWVAREDDGRISGVVQLKLVAFPNGRHRAEVAKLLVHRAARHRGVAGGLMDTLERHAQLMGRTLLLLDTQTGSAAELLYERRGWRRVGVVDDHAATPDGQLAPTTFMSKRL